MASRCDALPQALGALSQPLRHTQVADFGLSRVLSAEAVSTGTYGTVTHMPVELLTTGALVACFF